MAENRSTCVDAEIQLEIQNGNKAVIQEMKEFTSENTRSIKEYLDIKLAPTERDVDRLRADVGDLYNKDRDMRDRVGFLEQRQSNDEGVRAGDTGARDKFYQKKETWIGVAGILAAIFFFIYPYIKK